MLHSDDRPQRRRESYSDHREERSYKREVYDVRDKRDSHRASMGDRDRDQDMRPRDSYPPKQRRDDRDDYYSNDNKRSAGNSRGYDERPPRRDRRDTADAKPSNQLGLFGFDRDHTEQDLEDEFNRYGTVENAVIIYVKGTKRSKGFGFITMSSLEEAKSALESIQSGDKPLKWIKGDDVRVDYSLPRPPQQLRHPRNDRDGYSDRRDRNDGYNDRRPREQRDRYDRRDTREHRPREGRSASPPPKRRSASPKSPMRDQSPI